jgi:thiol-disulfide isomerase/thioredoxin
VHRPSRLLALCAVVAALGSACTGTKAVSDGSDGPQLRQLAQAGVNHLLAVEDRPPAPKMQGDTLTGEPLDIASLRGKVVVVNFWASWCAPCRAESARLVKVAKDTGPLGVEFVGIDFKDTRSGARRFVEVHDVPYPSLFDQPGVILTRLHRLVPQKPPSTMVLDRQGRIAALFIGGITEAQLAEPVRALARET